MHVRAKKSWKPSSITLVSCRDRRWKGGKEWGERGHRNSEQLPFRAISTEPPSTTQLISPSLLAMHPTHLLISLFDFL